MKNEYTRVCFAGVYYKVGIVQHGNPFVVDDNIDLPDVFFDKTNNGYIRYSSHPLKYLHHFIKPYNGVSIDHINQIKTDNRVCNLRYADQSTQNKNQSKRKRNVILPPDCGVNPQDIPTFIWYINPHGAHGDRWMVEIKDKYEWKTTSAKSVSTKCKFEMAKKHLRNLITTAPDMFKDHSINGKLSEYGDILKQEYIDILKLANFTYEDSNHDDLDKDYLKANYDGLTQPEISILEEDGDYVHKMLPDNFNVEIPKNCYYVPKTKEKGDGFCCGRLHPKHNKDWTTTRSRKVSIQEKYKQLMCYLQGTEYTPLRIAKKPIVKLKTCVSPEEKFALLTEPQLHTVMQMKKEGKTTQDVTNYIKENFNGIYINRNHISKLWNDEVRLPEHITAIDDYQKMISNKKQRTMKGKKFTDEELEWVRQNNTDKSLSVRVKLFEEKYGKTITKTYLSKCAGRLYDA